MLEPLLAASLPADVGEAGLRDALVARGASDEEAEAADPRPGALSSTKR